MANPSSNYEAAVEIREQLRQLEVVSETGFGILTDTVAQLPVRRDLFAAFAMQQLMGRLGLFPSIDTPEGKTKQVGVCQAAWHMADLMIQNDPMPKTPSPENK